MGHALMARSTATTLAKRTTSDFATERLAVYAAAARFDDLPQFAVERAKQCLIDAIACAIFGRQFPWSVMVLEEALSIGMGGPCRVPRVPGKTLHVPQAAPGAGVHPGATVALPALAMAQAVNASGKDLIAAIVAGVEVMFRIGAATSHSPEHLGLHAPGLTGPFGSAAACISLMPLSPRAAANAFGIAGLLAPAARRAISEGSSEGSGRFPLGRNRVAAQVQVEAECGRDRAILHGRMRRCHRQRCKCEQSAQGP